MIYKIKNISRKGNKVHYSFEYFNYINNYFDILFKNVKEK